MPPFVPNGLYKIRNVEFSRDVAGFTEGARGPGPILGFIDRPGKINTLWRIKNVGGGGNEIIIESISAPGNFASAAQFANARLFGTPDQTVWTVVKEDSGFYLQSPNAEFVWQLTRDGDLAQIVLIPFTGQDNTKWTFDRVGN
ncbi:hypothetical protein L210DRAFT_3652374 [Boletus edulis BED1]|uniref:Ricin B lectin domain-containing protein n=1 Tax=Boletus edulis BED1 TaxID=1328754 RepID=A0AAD4G8L0_BOLED|nr:hypothetical protein L210DRAFT_3652374 [Boletus edulis BED1]